MQAYMKIDGMDGQVTEKGHEKWIHIGSFNFGAEQEGGGDPSQQGKLVAGAVYYRDLTVTKDVDTVSPLIASACSSGKHIKSLTIEVCEDTNKVEPVLKLELSDVLISSYALSGLAETLHFRYSKIKMSATAIDQQGKKGATAQYTWDLLQKKLA